MRKIIITLISIALLVVLAYSSKNAFGRTYIYKGENESWIAEYRLNTSKSLDDAKLTVSYKRDLSELSSMKHLEISYKASLTGGNLVIDFGDDSPKEKSYTLKSDRTGGAVVNQDEIVKVNINLDGKTQTIELKNVK